MSAQQTASAGGGHRLLRGLNHQVTAGLTVGAIVFLAAIAGILLRPSGHLSTFWAANAILLGLVALYIGMSYLAAPLQQLFEHGLRSMLGFFLLR